MLNEAGVHVVRLRHTLTQAGVMMMQSMSVFWLNSTLLLADSGAARGGSAAVRITQHAEFDLLAYTQPAASTARLLDDTQPRLTAAIAEARFAVLVAQQDKTRSRVHSLFSL